MIEFLKRIGHSVVGAAFTVAALCVVVILVLCAFALSAAAAALPFALIGSAIGAFVRAFNFIAWG